MRYFSVCSGIEAATLAWRPLGWRAVGFSEYDPEQPEDGGFAARVLAHYYPEVPNLGDLNAFKSWPKIEAEVLVGGTPCQSFSVAGLRKGLADPRGNLTLVYLALADRIRPEWLVWENVPGVLSHDHGRTFGAILGALVKLGYGFAYRVLDARYFGVPQRRRRVFLVANSRAWQRAAAVLFEPESLRGDSPPGGPTREDLAGTLTRSALDGSSASGQDGRTGFLVAGPVLGNGGRSGWRSGAEEAAGNHLIPEVADPISAHEGDTYTHEGRGNFRLHNVVGDVPDVANVLTRRMTKGVNSDLNEGQTLVVAAPLTAGGHPNSAIPGRHKEDDENIVACFDETQITHRENRSTADPDAAGLARTARPPAVALNRSAVEIRRLTPRECERLQGFPDDFTLVPYRGKPASDSQRYQAVGNTIARPVLEWIGRRIATVSEAP
jgi:DNA (cytosine-5)-methyltransferase 1